MTAATAERLRIGEAARRLGTTTRTIRYYEEIGLLGLTAGRAAGQHRLFDEADIARLRDALRLKELLGLTLEELGEVIEAEEARAALRDEWHHRAPSPARRREIAGEALAHLERQLALVRRRREEIGALERELLDKRARLRELAE